MKGVNFSSPFGWGNVTALAVAAVMLSGCSVFQIGESSYSCKVAKLGGVACHSAREVYEMTNNVSYLDQETVNANARAKVAEAEGARAVSSGGFQKDPVSTPEKTVPVRTPATVMRAWFGPYTDEDDMLHSSEKVFVEIERSKWLLGETTVGEKQSRIITPLKTGSRLTQDFTPLATSQK